MFQRANRAAILLRRIDDGTSPVCIYGNVNAAERVRDALNRAVSNDNLSEVKNLDPALSEDLDSGVLDLSVVDYRIQLCDFYG